MSSPAPVALAPPASVQKKPDPTCGTSPTRPASANDRPPVEVAAANVSPSVATAPTVSWSGRGPHRPSLSSSLPSRRPDHPRAEPRRQPVEVLTGAALRWVLRLVPLASLVGEQVDASLDIELACEIDRVIPGDEDMRRLRVDDAGDASPPRSTPGASSRPRRSAVGGHHARVGADDPVGLDRTADAGVEPRVRFEGRRAPPRPRRGVSASTPRRVASSRVACLEAGSSGTPRRRRER